MTYQAIQLELIWPLCQMVKWLNLSNDHNLCFMYVV